MALVNDVLQLVDIGTADEPLFVDPTLVVAVKRYGPGSSRTTVALGTQGGIAQLTTDAPIATVLAALGQLKPQVPS